MKPRSKNGARSCRGRLLTAGNAHCRCYSPRPKTQDPRPQVLMPLVLVSSKRFADHVTPAAHPERPGRAAVLQAVAASFREQGGEVIDPRSATDEDLLRVHTQEHVDAIVATPGKEQ